MIIDLILDRKGGVPYNAHDFYIDVMAYESDFGWTDYKISRAMDEGTNKDVQKALCDYIDDNEYNPKIKDYINSQVWVEDD